MKKISCLILFSLLLISCNAKKQYENVTYKYNKCIENGIGHDYFEVYDNKTLVLQIDDVVNYKISGKNCFAVFYDYPKPFYGYYFKNGNIVKKVKSIEPKNIITSNLKYVIYLKKVDDEFYTDLIITDIKTGKVVKIWNLEELKQNHSFNNSLETCVFNENGNNLEINLLDGWEELFEKFELNLDTLELVRIPVEYSKNNPENTKNLPSLH